MIGLATFTFWLLLLAPPDRDRLRHQDELREHQALRRDDLQVHEPLRDPRRGNKISKATVIETAQGRGVANTKTPRWHSDSRLRGGSQPSEGAARPEIASDHASSDRTPGSTSTRAHRGASGERRAHPGHADEPLELVDAVFET